MVDHWLKYGMNIVLKKKILECKLVKTINECRLTGHLVKVKVMLCF